MLSFGMITITVCIIFSYFVLNTGQTHQLLKSTAYQPVSNNELNKTSTAEVKNSPVHV